MAQTKEISGKSLMTEILEAYPSAKRALFQRYHIGGCSSCGFAPSDSLEDVLASHNVVDIEGTIEYIKDSQKIDDAIRLDPRELVEVLKKDGKKPALIDVREQWEYDIAHIEGALLMTRTLVQEIMDTWPKDTQLVFTCHRGMRSLDAASYFIGHGFTNVRSLDGGIDRWAQEIDPKVARY